MEASNESGGRFETCPPPMVQIEGDLVSLSDRLRLAMVCVGNSTRRTTLSSLAGAVLNPVSESRRRAYFPPLVATPCPLDYQTFGLELVLNLVPKLSDQIPGDLSRNCETTSDNLFFSFPPIAVVNSRAQTAIIPDIRCSSMVALSLREPTLSPLVKYMCILDGKFYASSWRWSIFKITVIPETDSKDHDDDAVSYGSTIVLTDIDTGITSRPYVVCEAKNGKFSPGNGSVKELQSLAFHRLRKEDGSSVYLSIPTESRSAYKPEDEHVDKSPLIDEARTPLDAGRRKDDLFARASWTIVAITSSSFSFFDLFQQTPSVGLSPIFPPFPMILQTSEIDVSDNAIFASIYNFYYTDRETGQRASFEVWLGAKGPLDTLATEIAGNKWCMLRNAPRLIHSPSLPNDRSSFGGRDLEDLPPTVRGGAHGNRILRRLSS
jgi:hypothetical protein